MQVKNIVYGRKYKAKSGEEKTQWINCGTLFINDEGKMSIKFNPFINPVAFVNEKGEVWLNVFEANKEKEKAVKPTSIEGNTAVPAQDEDVPF